MGLEQDLFDEEYNRRTADAAEMLVLSGQSVAGALDSSDAGSLGDVLGAPKGQSLWDGSAPLDDPMLEAFAGAVAEGIHQTVAYQKHVSSKCTRESAASQASRVMRRPEVAGRVRALIRLRLEAGRGRAGSAGAAGGRAGAADPAAPVGDGSMTKAQKLGHLEAIIHSPASTASDRVRAIQEHNRLSGDTKPKAGAKVPDPAFLCDYLRFAEEQGLEPIQAAKDGLQRDGEPEPEVGETEEDDHNL